MKTFEYRITSSVGIHARPAGLLAREAAAFSSEISVSANGKTASAKKLFALMKLGAKQNDLLAVAAEGADEEAAIARISDILSKNF
jgi:phosphocarrier protein HPr